jgi:ABC-2 type transport system permease protein
MFHNINVLTYRNLVCSISPIFIVYHVLIPAIFIFVGGYSFGTLIHDNAIRIGHITIPYITFLTTGIITFNIVWTCAISGNIIWNDKVSGMFEQLLSSNFTRVEYVIANLLTIMIIGAIGASAVIIIGIPVLIYHTTVTPMGILYIASSMIACSILFGSIALLISFRFSGKEALSFQKETLTLSIIFNLVIFISSIFYPTYVLSVPLQIVASFNPVNLINDVLRAGFFSQVFGYTNIEMGILVILSIVAICVAAFQTSKIDV